jgi:hypothetical protein
MNCLRTKVARGCIVFALVAAGFGGAACTRTAPAQGKPITADVVARIVPGRTTEAEIREWFGEPTDVVATDTGKVLTYQHRSSSGSRLSVPFLGIGGSAAPGQMLIVTLDREGRVARQTFIGGP